MTYVRNWNVYLSTRTICQCNSDSWTSFHISTETLLSLSHVAFALNVRSIYRRRAFNSLPWFCLYFAHFSERFSRNSSILFFFKVMFIFLLALLFLTVYIELYHWKLNVIELLYSIHNVNFLGVVIKTSDWKIILKNLPCYKR